MFSRSLGWDSSCALVIGFGPRAGPLRPKRCKLCPNCRPHGIPLSAWCHFLWTAFQDWHIGICSSTCPGGAHPKAPGIHLRKFISHLLIWIQAAKPKTPRRHCGKCSTASYKDSILRVHVGAREVALPPDHMETSPLISKRALQNLFHRLFIGSHPKTP